MSNQQEIEAKYLELVRAKRGPEESGKERAVLEILAASNFKPQFLDIENRPWFYKIECIKCGKVYDKHSGKRRRQHHDKCRAINPEEGL